MGSRTLKQPLRAFIDDAQAGAMDGTDMITFTSSMRVAANDLVLDECGDEL